MNRYSSGITFLYYKNFEKARLFFEEVLQLDLVMDQGFATVYKVSGSSFIGCVKKKEGSIKSKNKGGTLVSLTSRDVEGEYERIKKYRLPFISEIEIIERIPLKSFFLKDFEGHDFEIQEFLKKEDREIF